MAGHLVMWLETADGPAAGSPGLAWHPWTGTEGTAGRLVLRWAPTARQPTLTEALRRLDRLRDHGPAWQAFTFRECVRGDGLRPTRRRAVTPHGGRRRDRTGQRT